MPTSGGRVLQQERCHWPERSRSLSTYSHRTTVPAKVPALEPQRQWDQGHVVTQAPRWPQSRNNQGNNDFRTSQQGCRRRQLVTLVRARCALHIDISSATAKSSDLFLQPSHPPLDRPQQDCDVHFAATTTYCQIHSRSALDARERIKDIAFAYPICKNINHV